MKKKHQQLEMNHSTASGRLIKDILYSFVEKTNNKCYRCGDDMSRETFSVDHIVPWLDSENPTEVFFDLGNISFSHGSCNVKLARKPSKKYASKQEASEAAARLRRERWLALPLETRKEIRKENYRRWGK
jgi:hypothetical protein